ncbi:unnamed protein product, partial [marine sediment metagenome]
IPTTAIQLDLGRVLVEELKELGLEGVIQDEFGFVYANLPPSKGYEKAKPIGLLAHVDTSPAVNGKNVKPVIHHNYDGKEIKFAQDKDLTLNFDDSPPSTV